MKALILADKNQPLLLGDSPDPVPSTGEAVVKIHAAALNHRDLWIRKGRYAGLKYPIILGSDGSGIVESVADQRDKEWIGKSVIIYPAIHWGPDQSHQHPSDFKIIGLPDNGTMAEYIGVPVSNLFPKPAHLSFEEAAALPLAGLTAYRALFKRAALQSGEKILITGIGGGVAQFALQFAVSANAEIYVSSGDGEKLKKAVQLGARNGVNYNHPQWVQELRSMAGSFDLILDGAGGDGTNALLDLAKPGGSVVFYGSTMGAANQVEMRRIFWKQLNVLGSTMGSPEDFKEMTGFVTKHTLKPVVDQVFPFDQGENAMNRMDEGKQFGKIVIKIK